MSVPESNLFKGEIVGPPATAGKEVQGEVIQRDVVRDGRTISTASNTSQDLDLEQQLEQLLLSFAEEKKPVELHKRNIHTLAEARIPYSPPAELESLLEELETENAKLGEQEANKKTSMVVETADTVDVTFEELFKEMQPDPLKTKLEKIIPERGNQDKKKKVVRTKITASLAEELKTQIEIKVKDLKRRLTELNSIRDLTDNTKDTVKALAREQGYYESALSTLTFAEGENRFANLSAHPLAKGKAKVVHEDLEFGQKVYYTPVKGIWEKIFGSKKREIKSEVETVQAIKTAFREKGIDQATSNLFLDMEEVKEEKRINGQYTVEATRAGEDDLEKVIQRKKLSFLHGARICLDIANGMRCLHKAGYVHGDLKPENVLIFEEEGKSIAKISDYGKTGKLSHDESRIYTGNPRFAPPEGRLSQKGEVYSTALMMIRVFEANYLDETNEFMLKRPTRTNETVNDKRAKSGVEKFLILNQSCPQTEKSTWMGKVKYLARSLKLAFKTEPPLVRAQEEIHLYIDELCKKMDQDHAGNVEMIKQIEELGNLLKKMTQSNPTLRPNMTEAVKDYNAILREMEIAADNSEVYHDAEDDLDAFNERANEILDVYEDAISDEIPVDEPD